MISATEQFCPVQFAIEQNCSVSCNLLINKDLHNNEPHRYLIGLIRLDNYFADNVLCIDTILSIQGKGNNLSST